MHVCLLYWIGACVLINFTSCLKRDLSSAPKIFLRHFPCCKMNYGCSCQTRTINWSVVKSFLCVFMHNNNYLCLYVYWVSKETYHCSRGTLTKIQSIKMDHNWVQISSSIPYHAHLKKKKVCLSWKGVKLQEVIFQRSQKLLNSQARSLAQAKTCTAVI